MGRGYLMGKREARAVIFNRRKFAIRMPDVKPRTGLNMLPSDEDHLEVPEACSARDVAPWINRPQVASSCFYHTLHVASALVKQGFSRFHAC